jgi:hypothetical protein
VGATVADAQEEAQSNPTAATQKQFLIMAGIMFFLTVNGFFGFAEKKFPIRIFIAFVQAPYGLDGIIFFFRCEWFPMGQDFSFQQGSVFGCIA